MPLSAFIPRTLLRQDKLDPLGFGNLPCLQVSQDHFVLGFQNSLYYLSSFVIPLFTPTAPSPRLFTSSSKTFWVTQLLSACHEV